MPLLQFFGKNRDINGAKRACFLRFSRSGVFAFQYTIKSAPCKGFFPDFSKFFRYGNMIFIDEKIYSVDRSL